MLDKWEGFNIRIYNVFLVPLYKERTVLARRSAHVRVEN